VQVPAGLELAHLQDLDEAEGGAETAKGRELVGIDLWHAAHHAGCSPILAALVIGKAALRRGLVLVDAVVVDLQDLDGTERGSQLEFLALVVVARLDAWRSSRGWRFSQDCRAFRLAGNLE
jgi:hypothetical protein